MIGCVPAISTAGRAGEMMRKWRNVDPKAMGVLMANEAEVACAWRCLRGHCGGGVWLLSGCVEWLLCCAVLCCDVL